MERMYRLGSKHIHVYLLYDTHSKYLSRKNVDVYHLFSDITILYFCFSILSFICVCTSMHSVMFYYSKLTYNYYTRRYVYLKYMA